MQDMERRKFEESWKEAFDQATFRPSDNVWTNIELELEKEKGTRLKRRLLFYQTLAAASVVFSLSFGIYILGNKDMSSPQQIAARVDIRETDKDSNASQSTPSISPESNKQYDADQVASNNTMALSANSSDDTHGEVIVKQRNSNVRSDRSETVLPQLEENDVATKDERDITGVFAPSNRELPALAEVGKIELKLPSQETSADPVALMLAKLEQRERELNEDQVEKKNAEKYRDENLWTSLGFSAGPFSTINSGSDVSPPPPPSSFKSQSEAALASNAVLATVAEKEAKASGITYSMGVNLGTKLTERWVLQGGVNYMAQSSKYTQEYLIGSPDNSQVRPAIYDDFRKNKVAQPDAQSENLIRSAPYSVNNNVSYLSVPLQAGYMIINRDFGLQLNAGVSTDVFLQNTTEATADGDQVKVDPSTTGFGEDSAFRPVNLSGLMGTEISYKVGEHYRISLNPGLRYPFNSIYKSDTYNTTRVSFDLGLRFRYIFH